MADRFERFMARAAIPMLIIWMVLTLIYAGMLYSDGIGWSNIICRFLNDPCVQGLHAGYVYWSLILMLAVLAALVPFARDARHAWIQSQQKPRS